jgi:hypothetical protein
MEKTVVIGQCNSHHLTGDNKIYNVINFKNIDEVNFRIFWPGEKLELGTKVKVSLEILK